MRVSMVSEGEYGDEGEYGVRVSMVSEREYGE